MKLVSISLLIEALAARWNSDATPEMEQVADFITEYAKDSAFDIPLKTVLAHYDAEPGLFNPKADMPLTPGQYEALYKEDFPSSSAFNWEPADTPALGQRVRITPLRPSELPMWPCSGTAGKVIEAMGNQELSPTGRLRKSQPELQEFPKAATAYQHCPFCGTMATYTHRDGLPVCKCPVNVCKGYDRWLEYDDFAALNPKPTEENSETQPGPAKPFIDPGHCLTTRVCVGCGKSYHTRSEKVALCFDCQEANSL